MYYLRTNWFYGLRPRVICPRALVFGEFKVRRHRVHRRRTDLNIIIIIMIIIAVEVSEQRFPCEYARVKKNRSGVEE